MPQPPLGHPEAPGVVHKDEALLDTLMIGGVPYTSRFQQEKTKYENTAASTASNGKVNVNVFLGGAHIAHPWYYSSSRYVLVVGASTRI